MYIIKNQNFNCKELCILTFQTLLCKRNFKIASLTQLICLLMERKTKKHIILSITLHISSLPEPLPCELNFIEQCWGYVKHIYWHYPASSKEADLECNMLMALETVPLESMRK